MKRKEFLRTGMILLFFSVLFVPVAGALTQSTGQPDSQRYVIQENVKIISPLRMHIAYVGRTQQARMDGVITYIDGISGGTGTTGLRQIQEDYLTAAFPVPMMHTVEEITTAREEMQRQSILFTDETNIQMVKFNGNFTDMRSSTEAALRPVEESFSCLRYASWLASQATRSRVFNQSSERRTAILEDLSLHGLDVTYPKDLSSQIDEQQAELESALLQNRDGVLLSINSGLKVLKQQFRSTVEVYRMNLQAQMKAAEWTP
ncbi:MAG: hypothetical protein LUQ04_09895 [Methanoregula sp.]|nr:hypothetical protein [Methanoregula sp.]